MTVGSSYRDRHARESASNEVGSWRFWLVGTLLTLCAIALLARGLYLQYFNQDFLERQGNARILRDVKLSANRGMVLDRNGEPLAVSTPVDTVWADPRKLAQHPQDFAKLAQALGRDKNWLARRVTSNLDREFVYLVRHMRPQDADKVKALGIPGVDTLREYRRYYPAGEVTGHLLGFTNVDDVGQEGLELAFDEWLGGVPGVKRVMRDRQGRTLEDIELIKAPRPGQDLRTSIDLRVQYLAYRALKQAVQVNEAQGGSVVVLDIETGEVLAMVNQPAFNPNDREQYLASRYRNRATNDFFEPGSSIKPFVVGAAMKTGRYHADTLVETGPGTLRVGIKTIKDKHNLGTIDVRTCLEKSSNVCVVKIALTMKPQEMWQAPALRSQPDGDDHRARGRRGLDRSRPHPRGDAGAPAPARAGDPRLARRGRPRGPISRRVRPRRGQAVQLAAVRRALAVHQRLNRTRERTPCRQDTPSSRSRARAEPERRRSRRPSSGSSAARRSTRRSSRATRSTATTARPCAKR